MWTCYVASYFIFNACPKKDLPTDRTVWIPQSLSLFQIHAKLGDFEGCGHVLKEMASSGGHAPTQAAYTSLLAACYKICNDSGRNSLAVRAKAGTFGWKYWQEMRIVGIEADGE